MPSQIDMKAFLALISPDGQRRIADIIERAKAERGSKWLDEITATYPTLAWIVTLVANHDADTAFEMLKARYPGYPLQLVRSKLVELHGALKTEIDRPRG